MNFDHYETADLYDEMFDKNLQPRFWYRLFKEWIERLEPGELVRRQHAAERALLAMGITFNVYMKEGTEHIFPFDTIPRIINASECKQIERGLQQRIYALNLFIDDIYHQQKIIIFILELRFIFRVVVGGVLIQALDWLWLTDI
jgi:uncharacterized circularly permuted ATP-grasp superfamily protein